MELTFNIDSKNILKFWGEEINTKHDFFIKSNSNLEDVELLLFFDSRGISAEYETSLIKMILDHIDEGINYLVIARPLEITTWLTLYNFLRLNNLGIRKIITNMGFVDFTPKKESITKLTLLQYQLYFANLTPVFNFKEVFTNQDDDKLNLYIQQYPTEFLNALVSMLSNYNVIALATPYVSEEIEFSRIRPKAFYEGLNLTRSFSNYLESSTQLLDIPEFSERETYDAVHFTYEGNKKIFSLLKPFLS
jgi:hypothetical protein